MKRSTLAAMLIALALGTGEARTSPALPLTEVNYDFEDGVVRGTPTHMEVPPKILTESGNKFMRITGSSGDRDSIPASYPDRNRSTVTFTSSFSSMPLTTSANMRQTYSAKIRFLDDTGSDGTVFELFQAGQRLGGYGTIDGQGPVVIFWRNNGRVAGRANYVVGSQLKWNNFDLGTIPAGTWHTYGVKAVWSHDPAQGLIEIYFDGNLKMRVTGRDANLHPTSNRLPMLKLGLYGDFALGSIDVDNIKVHPTEAGAPPPPPPPGGNLVPNGAMEGSKWTSGRYGSTPNVTSWGTDQSRSPAHSLKTSSSSAYWNYFKSGQFAVSPGRAYTLSAWVRTQGLTTDADSRGITLNIHWYDSGGTFIAWRTVVGGAASGTMAWTKRIGTVTAPSGTATARVEFRIDATGGTAWMDDVSLVEQ